MSPTRWCVFSRMSARAEAMPTECVNLYSANRPKCLINRVLAPTNACIPAATGGALHAATNKITAASPTPPSSSWMHRVERFYRDLTEAAIRAGSFSGVNQLFSAIEDYLAERDLN